MFSARPEVIGWDSPPRVGVVDHLLIIRALVIRETRLRYQNNPLGILMAFVRPVAICGAHIWLWSLIARSGPAHTPIATFVLGGFSVWFVFSGVFHATERAGRSSSGANRIPGVTRMHLRIAKSVWPFLSNFLFCVFAVIPLNVFVYQDQLEVPNLLLTVLIMSMTACIGFGYGLILDGMGRRFPIVEDLSGVFRWMIFVSSAIYYSLSTSSFIKPWFFWYNPLAHLIEYQRYAYTAAYPIGTVTLAYPAIMTVVMLLVGMMTNRCMRHIPYR